MDVNRRENKLRISFTKPKFLGLPLKQQHKKCATLLRLLYDLLLAKNEVNTLLSHYNELQSWMELSPLETVGMQPVSDRYHEHLSLAEQSLREHNLLPCITTKDRDTAEPTLPIAIYLNHLRSAYNVGSILRTVEGLSIGTVYFSDNTPYIDHKQVQDSSMGAYEHVECKRCHSLDSLPRPLIVMETSEEAIPLNNYIFPKSFTLIMGNEEYGCSKEVLQQADHLVTIPMRGRKNSLNVANAFSMAAQEIIRQREDQNYASVL